MSDSFADLWNSSVPPKKPQTLSSLAQQSTQQSNQQRRQQGPDLFTLLSSSPSPAARSSPSIPSITTSTTSTPPPQGSTPPQKSTTSGDAFSDLLSSSSFASSSSQNLTIAQRAALAEKQRKEALLSQKKQQEKEKSAWAGLDTLGGGFGGLTPTPAAVTSAPANVTKATSQSSPGIDDDDWGLGDFGKPTLGSSQGKPKPAGAPARNNHDDGWDLDDFESPQGGPATTTTDSTSKTGKTIWDLGDFSPSPPATTNIRNGRTSSSRIDSPSNDFDFGKREDTLLNRNDDDDFMGVFNKPPQPKPNLPHRSPSPSQPTISTSSPGPPSNTTRSGSPPPHVLGQIVEMGFSIPKAKAALAANNNDVQAALEQLLASEGGPASNGRGTPVSRNSPAPHPPQQPQQPQPGIPRRRDREILRERDPRRQDTSSPASGTSTGTGEIQMQAEQLFAQASEIGRGMFTKASAFWKEKKVQVQKVVEDQVAGVRVSSAPSGTSNASSGPSGSGRPKWMQHQQDEFGDEDQGTPKRSGFRDGDDDAGAGQREPEAWIPRRVDRQREKERERGRVREREAAVPQPTPPAEEPEIDLFAPSEPVPAASSQLFNADGPNLFQESIPTEPSPAARSRPQLPRQRSQQHQPGFQRDTTPIPSTITSLKLEANSTFKLGQFGNAEQLYMRAIDTLGKSAASNHIYYVILLNNRANARMKTGDVGGAVRDCEAVIGLITKNKLEAADELDSMLGGGKVNDSSNTGDVKIDWEPSQDGDARLHISIQGGDPSEEVVDLGEGLVKAIKRRAEAYEGMEKWGKAKKDWEWLRSTGWVRESFRSEAGRGVGRCARMIEGNTNSTSGTNGSSSSQAPKPAVRPRPKPTPRPTNNTKPSEALQALRSTTAKAEAEDQAKHELKDATDAKLSNWKSGKETNIRALLASLDLVLWEELLSSGGGVKVGLHELVTPAQVKIKYMKAVAKVHPDKLNANNSTLEQRMIAQGVFGALNEAWNAFKQ